MGTTPEKKFKEVHTITILPRQGQSDFLRFATCLMATGYGYRPLVLIGHLPLIAHRIAHKNAHIITVMQPASQAHGLKGVGLIIIYTILIIIGLL